VTPQSGTKIMNAFDYVDFQFKLSHPVIARRNDEAIQLSHLFSGLLRASPSQWRGATIWNTPKCIQNY